MTLEQDTARNLLAQLSDESSESQALLFSALEAQVDSFLSYCTFGRSAGLLTDEASQKLFNCREECLCFLVREECTPAVTTETVADWSRTLAMPQTGTREGKLLTIARRWLADTGLLYCGV